MLKRLLTLLFLFSSLNVLYAQDQHNHNHFEQGFIQNKGQFEAGVLAQKQIESGVMFLDSNGFTFHFMDYGKLIDWHLNKPSADSNMLINHHAYKVVFKGATKTGIQFNHPQNEKRNYFIGNDSEKWATNVKSYLEGTYPQLYPGIDLELLHQNGELKYQFILAPGSDPNWIELEYQGVENMYLHKGKLHVHTTLSETWEEKPYAYQVINGKKKKVECEYALNGQTLSYVFPKGYQSQYPLIIDPTVVFSSYSGSTANNFGYSAAFDAFGYLYSASTAFALGYPTTLGAFQINFAGGGTGGVTSAGTDIVLTKWDTTGTSLIWSTYYGGTKDELPHSIICNDFGELYLMGTTSSSNLPMHNLGYDTSFAGGPAFVATGLGVNFTSGSDLFVVKFNSLGNALLGSTFLGGSGLDGINNGYTSTYYNYADEVRGEIDFDNNGDILIASCTRSNDIPMSANGYQSTKPTSGSDLDGIIFNLTPDLQTLNWNTYYGGNNGDAIFSIDVDTTGNLYVTGATNSTTLPMSTNGYNTANNGGTDAFVAAFDGTGSNLLYATYFGTGASERSYFIELDEKDFPYIFGQNNAPAGALIQNATYNVPSGGQFITKFKRQLDQVVWSTRFGRNDGDPDISPTAFLVDFCESIYLSGWGSSIQGVNLTTQGLPITSGPNNAAFQSTTDNNDFYIMVMDTGATTISYATYYGGSADEHVDGGTSRFDRSGKIYQAVCAGCGGTSDFPTSTTSSGTVYSSTNDAPGAGCNLAVFKMDFELPYLISNFFVDQYHCVGDSVFFENLSEDCGGANYVWDFGDGTTSTDYDPTHVYSAPGTYTVTLSGSSVLCCNTDDYFSVTIIVDESNTSTLPSVVACPGIPVSIGDLSLQTYDSLLWNPFTDLSANDIATPVFDGDSSTNYLIQAFHNACVDSLLQSVVVQYVDLDFNLDSLRCTHFNADTLSVLSGVSNGSFHWSSNINFTDSLNTNNDSSIVIAPTDSVTHYYIKLITAENCEFIDSFTVYNVDQLNWVSAEFQFDSSVCIPFNGQVVNLSTSVGTPQYDWNWNLNTSSVFQPNINVASLGDFVISLIVSDSSVCIIRDTFELTVNVDADSAFSKDYFYCPNDEMVINFSNQYSNSATVTWGTLDSLSNAGFDSAVVIAENSIQITQTVVDVCTDVITHNVVIDSISANTPPILIVCDDQPSTTVTGNVGGGANTYFWSTQQGLSDTLNLNLLTFDAFINGGVDTVYFVALANSNCMDSSRTIVASASAMMDVSADTVVCFGEEVQLHAFNLFEDNDLSFQWSGTNIVGSRVQSTITVSPQTSGYYYVTGTAANGCSVTDSIFIDVIFLSESSVILSAGVDTIFEGDSFLLKVLPISSHYQYEWNLSTQGTWLSDYEALINPPAGQFTADVIVSDSLGICTGSDQITVYVGEVECSESMIFVPSAFSPNGDGENDVLFVRSNLITKMQLEIYDRWGNKVFESDDVNQGWDGTYKGKPLDPAVFYYHLRADCIGGATYVHKGDITLVR